MKPDLYGGQKKCGICLDRKKPTNKNIQFTKILKQEGETYFEQLFENQTLNLEEAWPYVLRRHSAHNKEPTRCKLVQSINESISPAAETLKKKSKHRPTELQ